jgi:hypothetical protein
MARKKKKYHFIYKTTNLLSGRYYIGMHSTDSLNDGYLGSGRRLRYSINKYGKENHKREILEFCNSRKELKSREEEVVNLDEIAKEECLNLKVGGTGGLIDDNHKKKWTLAGGNAYALKIKTDVEFRNKISSNISKKVKQSWDNGERIRMQWGNWKGRTHTEETKKKIGESNSKKQKGKNNSQYGTRWITNEEINKKIYQDDEIPKGFRLGRVLNNRL